MTSPLATVFGGSGFLGRYVVQRLARHGYRIRVVVRRPERAIALQPLGSVGQIQVIRGNILDEGTCKRALAGSELAINLVGILVPSRRQTFRAVHERGAANIARAAREAGVRSFIHVSAIGADSDASSAYGTSKAAGETAVLSAFPQATILRPAIIFGPEDDFSNRFAALGRRLPFMPVISGDTRLQPVYVADVADAIIAAAEAGAATTGKVYELGGPTIYSFRDFLRLIMKEAMISRPLIEIPGFVTRLMASIGRLLPNPPLTPDQLRSLERDIIVAEDALTLETLKVSPTPAEAILPAYLQRYRPKGQFSRLDAQS